MNHGPDQTQRRVMAFFDREASRFPMANEQDASPVRRLVNALFRRSLRLRYDRVMSECVNIEESRILDIGCGPGTYAIALARRGVRSVVGIDIAPRMIEIARQRAAQAGVADRCEFVIASLNDYRCETPFDYVIAMGVMDYVQNADSFVHKAMSMAGTKVMFSFPKRKGLLAWQRRLRYRRKCPVFMYTQEDLERLFGAVGGFTYTIESIARDWLVLLRKNARA